MIKNIVVPFILAASLASSIEASLGDETRCEHLTDVKPDPMNCSIFYVCSYVHDMEWLGSDCIDGMLFDRSTYHCGLPDHVDCHEGSWYISNFDKCEHPGLVAGDSNNCQRHYECAHILDHQWVKYECPNGLEFNSVTGVCDYPENVQCANASDISIGNVIKNASVTFEPCEPISSLKPDPKNCSRYYECTEAGWEGNECSIGLEFNPATSLCDYPKNVVCPSGISIRADGIPEPCGVFQYYPDPENCSGFYFCPGSQVLMRQFCPEGSLFDPILLHCNDKEKVKCAVCRGNT